VAPTAHDVEVAINVLRADSRKWSTVSTEVDALQSKVDGLHLGLAELGTLSQQAGVIATYQSAQQQLANLLLHGAISTHEVAARLLTAANTYEAHERANAEKFSQMKAVK
jgi:hypothetical protein